MIEFLRGWTLSLAGIIVFGSLCEMLLPNSVYKKYINLAIGLILCIAIVSPFVKGKTQKTSAEQVIQPTYDPLCRGNTAFYISFTTQHSSVP